MHRNKNIFGMKFIEIKLPAMGEGITDATITKWLVKEGDTVDIDTPIVEVATDKVDSEIPSPVEGKVAKRLLNEGDIPKVGQVLAVVEIEGEEQETDTPKEQPKEQPTSSSVEQSTTSQPVNEVTTNHIATHLKNGAFVPPLVRKIAQEEGLTQHQLESIKGSGIEGKLTKTDILSYLNSSNKVEVQLAESATPSTTLNPKAENGVEIIEMDRLRRLTANHMTLSKQTSAHVTSFIEVDMTNIVHWRERNKGKFEKQNGEKLTYTPFFFSAVVDAIKNYPILNSSVINDQIHIKKDLNLGMATALPNDNLIVPVIKNADRLNLAGLAFAVNDLARRARSFKLQPNEVQGGTFTITNLGAFDNLAGTPIINQPQVAILAVGSIKKRPVVIESPLGDTIGIRHITILSLSYDHRIIDGALGGAFLKQIATNLQTFALSDL
jgi:2-oxoglutarate dehydrogenase E2 component (dihydrolipoamide succinyltransferase)